MIENKETYMQLYYRKNREVILAKQKKRYAESIGKKKINCKICGTDISNLGSRHFRYCDNCAKTKISRQVKWYREHRNEINLKRREQRKCK